MNIWTIARITAREAIRQPSYFALVSVFAGLVACAYLLSDFQLGADVTPDVSQMGIASMTICGLLLSIMGSARSVHAEVEDRTAIMVLSKPIRRAEFVLGKFFGIFGAVLLADMVLVTVLCLTIWNHETGPFGHPADAEIERIEEYLESSGAGPPVKNKEEFRDAIERKVDTIAPARADTAQGLAIVAYGEAVAELQRWDRGESHDQNLALIRLDSALELAEEAKLTPLIDWIQRMRHFCMTRIGQRRLGNGLPLLLKGAVLALFQTAIVTAMAVAISTRFPFEVTAVVVPIFFALGHFVNRIQEFFAGGSWTTAGQAIYYLIPNLEDFNIDRAIATGGAVSGAYVAWTVAYGVVVTMGLLLVSIWLFQERELG